jgi:tryptophan-rich sensory protein
MFRIALETMGEDSSTGRAFADMWRYSEFRRIFQVITVVWGVMFLVESIVQAVIVETGSIDTAKNTSNLLPIAALILTFAWTRAYASRTRQRSGALVSPP